VTIDPRILRIVITFDDGSYSEEFSALEISVTGEKYTVPTLNKCSIRITNLKKETRDNILTEVTPFKSLGNLKRQTVAVFAGRETVGDKLIYFGDIIYVKMSQPPDVVTEIIAMTAGFQRNEIYSIDAGEKAQASKIADALAQKMGVTLQFDATDKTVTNHSGTMATYKHLEELQRLGDYDVYIDDDTLVVKDKYSPASGGMHIISKETGMIGIPQFSIAGASVTVLMDESIRPGQAVQIVSELYPQTAATYTIYRLRFHLTNRDQPFYYFLDCARPVTLKAQEKLDQQAANILRTAGRG